MKVDAVDFFYLRMPEVLPIADGSQDSLLVRVRSGDLAGWGECESSPLTCIASWIAPMSHEICRPLSDIVLGERIESPEDIRRINQRVRVDCLDLLQADHTLSGIDIALWDLLGKARQVPVYELLGFERAFPKMPYASQLFGDTPAATYKAARAARDAGFRAAKFGWGPFGKSDVAADREHVRAAGEGLGDDAELLVDAGTVWRSNVERASERLQDLEECRVLWLEEPFTSDALGAYAALSKKCRSVRLAGGEGCHNFEQARTMVDHYGIGYLQVDAGRIGGISTAHEAALYARDRGITFVNHTFTTPLSLCASVQPYAGFEQDTFCEYPIATTDLARTLAKTTLQRGSDGLVRLPEAPGLGIELDEAVIKKYLVDTEISVRGKVLYRTPTL